MSRTTPHRELPTLRVREYEERPGAYYIEVGDIGRWIIDDVEEARRIVDAYNRAREQEPIR